LSDGGYKSTFATTAARTLAWSVVVATAVFVANNYLNVWLGWPGAGSAFGSGGTATLGGLQLASYVLAVVGSAIFVGRTPGRPLRDEAAAIYALTEFFIRWAFWVVLIIGLVDMAISFLRVEGLLSSVFGEQIAKDLGRPAYRGTYFHLPLIGLSVLIAAFTRTLGFTWLALLVVVAELQIVLTRFIFSYEQAFMADLVRFWYAGLFLFSSAYTLIEEGHVRVDVLYTGFGDRARGFVNAAGSLLLGVSLCAVVMWLGMSGKSSVINAPILAFEVTQQGFGMYVKYLMAGFLGVFAVSMMFQFAGYFLEGVADVRGDPGKRKIEVEAAH